MSDLFYTIDTPSSDQRTSLVNEYAPISRMVGIRVSRQNRMSPPQSEKREVEGRKAQSLNPELRQTPQSHLWTHRMVTEGPFPERELT